MSEWLPIKKALDYVSCSSSCLYANAKKEYIDFKIINGRKHFLKEDLIKFEKLTKGNDKWITASKAAKITGYTTSYINTKANEGKIRNKKSLTDNRVFLYNVEDIKEVFHIADKSNKNNKKKNKMLVSDKHCKGCFWKTGKVCMFRRCVRYNGWSEVRKKSKKKEMMNR